MSNDNKKRLFDALSSTYDLGTFEQFSQDIEDEGKRKKLYEATKNEYDYGGYDKFSSQLGYASAEPKPAEPGDFGKLTRVGDQVFKEGRHTSYLYEDEMSVNTGNAIRDQKKQEQVDAYLKTLQPEEAEYVRSMMSVGKSLEEIEELKREREIGGATRQTRQGIRAEEQKIEDAMRTLNNNAYYRNSVKAMESGINAHDSAIDAAWKQMQNDYPIISRMPSDPEAMAPEMRFSRGAEGDAKEAALRAATAFNESAREAATAPFKYDDSSGWVNAGKGAWDTLNDPEFWSPKMEVQNMQTLRKVLQKIQDATGRADEVAQKIANGDLSGVITPEEELMLSSYLSMQDARAKRAYDTSKAYKAGEMAAASTEFMLQMALTGGLSKAVSKPVVKGLGKWMMKGVGKIGTDTALQKATTAVAKKGARLVAGQTGNILSAAARQPFMWSTAEGVAQRSVEVGEDGKLLSMGEATAEGWLDALSETVTEGMGTATTEAIGSVLNVAGGGKILKALSNTRPGKFAEKAYKVFSDNKVAKALDLAGYQGLAEEWLEELDAAAIDYVRGNPDALADFFKMDNILTTIASFAPMTVLGGMASGGRRLAAEKDLKKSTELFQKTLADAGYTKEQIAYAIDLARSTTPSQMGEFYAPFITQQATQAGASVSGKQMFDAVKGFVQSVVNYQAIDGSYQSQMDMERDTEREKLEEQYGQFYRNRIAVNAKTGERMEASPVVETATLNDGSEVFIVSSPSESGEIAIIDEDGNQGFINEADIATIKTEEGGEYKLRGTQSLRSYLSERILERKEDAETVRMSQELGQQVAEIRQRYPVGRNDVVLGTEEAPEIGLVVAEKPEGDGVIIQTEKGVRPYTYEELAAREGKPLSSKTDAQIEEDDSDTILKDKDDSRKLRAFQQRYGTFWNEPQYDEDGNLVTEASVQAISTSNGESYYVVGRNDEGYLCHTPAGEKLIPASEVVGETSVSIYDFLENAEPFAEGVEQTSDLNEPETEEEPLPLKEDGSVDQVALWNNNPERWAQWNDEQRQDGGANSLAYVSGAIAKEQAKVAELQAAYEAESDFDKRDTIEKEITDTQARVERLTAIQQGYVAQAEAAQVAADEVAAEQVAPRISSQMSEQELAQMDAQHQARLESAKSTAAKREAMQNYINEISQGSIPMTLISMDEYEQVMKDAGCTPNQIAQVKEALVYAKRTNRQIPAFFVPRIGIFAFVENIPSIEQLRLTYIHERQHQFTAANKAHLDALLQLGVNRERMAEIVYKLSDSDFYKDDTAEALADEIISYAMERAYTYEDFSVALQELGIEQEIIDIITEIDNEQRNENSTYPSRRRGRTNLHDNSSRQGDRTENDRNQEPVSGGILDEQGDRSLGLGDRGTGSSREGAEVISEEQLNAPNSGTAQQITAADGEVLADTDGKGGVRFSIRTWNEGGRDYLAAWLANDTTLTEEEKTDILSRMDEFYKNALLYSDTYAPFGTWSDAGVRYDNNGNPLMSVIKANGDYAMNLDFSLVCKKRRPLNRLLRTLVNRNAFATYTLRERELAEINWILQEHGFEVACALCFVDSKRYRVTGVADVFAALYNRLVKSLAPEGVQIAHFNYNNNPNVEVVENGLDTMSDDQLDWDRFDRMLSAYKPGSVEYKVAQYLREHPEARKLVDATDFIEAEGFESVKENNPDLLKFYNMKKGTGGPKASFGDVQYLNDILKKEKSFDAEKAYAVGGVRLQSFSDFVPHMYFDYMQLFAELAAKKLPLHAYTKEVLFAKIFGLTGAKINMSLVPAVAEGGIAPGLDAEGNYVWADPVTDAEGNVIQQGQSFPYDEAMAIQQAEGYSKNCGVIAVGISDAHIEKMLDDPNIPFIIPYHKSSLNAIVARMTNIDQYKDYTKVQNTRKASGSKLDKGTKDFNFNEYLHGLGESGTPQQAAQAYLDWCRENKFIPKFSQFAYHPNYYKLLQDFNTIDLTTGEYAPQGAVTMTFPTEESAFGNVESLIQQGLQEDTALEEKMEQEIDGIADQVVARLEEISKEPKMSEKQQAKKMAELADERMAKIKEQSGVIDVFEEARKAVAREDAKKNKKAKKPEVRMRITPEQDKAYMDAVEAGDMETAQRMVIEAARAAGYNSPRLYHGTDADFTTFDKEFNDPGSEGFFFTNSEEMAASYGKNIKQVYLHVENPYVIEGNGRNWNQLHTDIFSVIPEIEDQIRVHEIAMKSFLDRGKITQGQYDHFREKYYDKVNFIKDESKDSIFDVIKKYIYRWQIRNFKSMLNVERTRDFEWFLQQLDSDVNIIFKDITDFGPNSADTYIARDVAHDVYVTTNPKNIKSADAVTYDDEGKVIPLSERFNPESSDIRFRTMRTDEQREQLFDNAKEKFGLTNNFKVAGYMLPDGSLLDFSEANDGGDPNQRTQDHREVADLIMDEGREYEYRYEYVLDFVGEGAIRMLPEYAGFQLSVPPTAEQRSKLMDYIYKYNGEVIMEITDENGGPRVYMEYNKRTSPSRIFRDMDGFFNEGIVPGIPPLRFRIANDNQAIFVSNAAKAVEGIKQEKATPEQWLKMIEKNGGLKAGEDKWMGLSDWLKESDKKTLTKQEVLDFINENMIQIEEVHYDTYAEERASDTHSNIVGVLQNKFNDYVAEYHEEHGYEDEYDDPASKYAIEKLREEMEDTFPYTIELVYGNEVYVTFDYEEEDEMVKWAEKTGVDYMPEQSPINETRLQYTTDGLENKHEIALTVPTIERWGQHDDVHFGDAGDGRAVAWIRFGETEVPTAEYKALLDEHDRLKDVAKETYDEFGGHSEEFHEAERRRYKIVEELRSHNNPGHKVLVIDEIQSKRHQEGRDKGYKTKDYWPLRTAYLEKKTVYESLYDEMAKKYGEEFTDAPNEEFAKRVLDTVDYERIMKAKAEFDAASDAYIPMRNAIPDAPFDKNWHELAMKRMLRYAAENGYDAIAWTKGEQQAERYNLGKFYSGIERQDNPAMEGRRFVLYGGNMDSFMVNDEGIVIESTINEAINRPLSDIVGKELAVKMMQMDDNDMLDDADLTIGGEGMKGFYDKMLPAFMNKYGKRWGVKVEDIDLPSLENGLTMHSVPVTEEMKASVMEGQVMFRVRGEDESAMDFHQSALNDFKKEFNIPAPTTIVDVNDRDAVATALGYTPEEFTDEQYDYILDGYDMGGSGIYDPETKRIAIFVDDSVQESGEVYHHIFHENTHHLIDKHPELLELGTWLWENSQPKWRRMIKEKILAAGEMYDGEETNEMLAGYAGIILAKGKAGVAYQKTPSELQKHWDLIFNAFGYEPEREGNNRGRGTRDITGGVARGRKNAEQQVHNNEASQRALSAEERRIIGEYFPGFATEEDITSEINTNPTEAQKKAGNYKMGHIRLDGYNITIENPKGSVRRGTDSKGNEWENTLNNDYGYIRGTEGVDGDHIDVYLSDNPSVGNVFVIDQVNPETREFDEHKVMYGFNSAEEAREAYLANFSEGWNGLGTITEVSKDEFKKWIESSHRKTKPFSEYKSVKTIGAQSEEEDMEDNLLPSTGTPTDEVVANGLQLTPAQTAEVAANIFAALPKESRKKITEGLNGNILGLKDAILQIPASLAMKENWNDEDKQMADIVAEEMTKMAGDMTRPFSASEGLWMLFDSLTPASSENLIDQASRYAVMFNLGFDKQTQGKMEDAKEEVRFRSVGDATQNASASLYNRGAVNVWDRLKESFVDMYASVESLVKAIEKSSGKKAEGFEDVLLALNQQSSKGLAAMEKYERLFIKPMMKAVRDIMKETGLKYEDVVRYVILKHGLERNKKLAQRDARAHYQEIYDEIISRINSMDDRQKRTYLTNAQLKEADAKAKLASLQATDTAPFTDEEMRAHKRELAKARKEVKEAKEHRERAEKIRNMSEQEAKDELDKIFESIEKGTDAVYKELREKDYSGISSMFYDQLGVDRKNFSTEEQYQAALMDAKKDKYSSLADVEAAAEAEVTIFEGKTDTQDLWKKINAATKETLRQQYAANMISKDQYLNLRDMFEYYVPLRGFKDNTAEDMYTYYRKPNSTGYTKPILGAEGRKTEAESPFGWIASMAGSAIASNMKNETKLALYYFVSNRPENGIATISKTWFVDSGEVDERGKKIFKPAYPPFSEGLSSAEGKAQYEIWQANMKELQKKGQAYEAGQRLNLGNAVVNISEANKPEHIVNVKVGGKDYTIVINGNPRAAQAINGDLNIEATGSADYSKFFGPMLRLLSSVNTSYNPEFWITNMQRDMLFTLMAVSTKGDAAYRRKFAKNYAKAFQVISLVAKNENGNLGNSYIERQYKDFVENGGVTGYTQIKDSETWEREIERCMKSSNVEDRKLGRVLAGMKDGFHAMHRFGESLEQVSRFAAFLTAREMGKDMASAISEAKDITVNFNRKGSGKGISFEEAKKLTGKNGRPLTKIEQWAVVGLSSIAPLGRRFIMFFNASIQGLNAMYKLYKASPGKMAAWTVGFIALGAMMAIVHAMMDDDDDYLDMPDYERRNSLMLGGNGVYFKWALPQESKLFYALGDLAVTTIMGRNKHKNILVEALKLGAEILPINPAEGWKAFLPSVSMAPVEVALNEDYRGEPIYNEQKWLSEEVAEKMPKWSSAYKGTGRLYIDISKILNNITGGDAYNAGFINIQPEKMQHLVQSAFGGTMRTADKFFTTISAALDPEEEVTIRQTPFLNRLLVINDERFRNAYVNEVFDFYKAEAEHTKATLSKIRKTGDVEGFNSLMQSGDIEVYQIYEAYNKSLKLYNEQMKVVTNPSERREIMKQQDELKRQMIKQISDLDKDRP